MEGEAMVRDRCLGGLLREMRVEEEEDDFRSCCEDEEVWKETEELLKEESKDELDEFSVRMFFKGVSITDVGESGSGLSGIGVVMERSEGVCAIQVQKKLDLYVEELVAEYLALMDGLVEATRNGICRVYAFTDSEVLYDQVKFLGLTSLSALHKQHALQKFVKQSICGFPSTIL